MAGSLTKTLRGRNYENKFKVKIFLFYDHRTPYLQDITLQNFAANIQAQNKIHCYLILKNRYASI